jgi:hypothetical protein
MKAAVLSLCLAAVLGADFSPPDWEFRRALVVDAAQRLCVVRIGPEIRRHLQPDLSDLRVVGDNGEVPYVLERLAGSVDERQLQPDILNKVSLPGVGVQVTLDLRAPNNHSRLRIATSETNFRRRVRIETSDDRQRWAVAREDAYLLDFEQDGRRFTVLGIDYPVSDRRYVRATFHDWVKPETLRDLRLIYRRQSPAVHDTVAQLPPVPAENSTARTSVYLLDAGEKPPPYGRVRLEAEEAAFHRAVEVESSTDGESWSHVAHGFLSRRPNREPPALSFAERRDRYLRVSISNEDDKPLAVGGFRLEAIGRQAKFVPEAAGRYWLYYGNSDARKPVYDLAMLLAGHEPGKGTSLAPGPEESNPPYRPRPVSVPWSERHPWLLHVTLAAAILIMGFVTIRFLLKLRRAE